MKPQTSSSRASSFPELLFVYGGSETVQDSKTKSRSKGSAQKKQDASGSEIDTEVVAVFTEGGKLHVPGDAAPYFSLLGRLATHAQTPFAGRQGTSLFVRFGGERGIENVLLAGMGAVSELTEEKARQAGGAAWIRAVSEKSASVRILADTFAGAQKAYFRPWLEGFLLNAYQFKKYRSEGVKPAAEGSSKKGTKKEAQSTAVPRSHFQGMPTRIEVFSTDAASRFQLSEDVEWASAMAEYVNLTRDLSNEPSNAGTPTFFAETLERIAKALGVKATTLTEADAGRERMNLYLAVGQGSEREGRIVILDYQPKATKNAKTVVLVGKGVTFDSGGISLKPGLRMEDMKHDMTGAATAAAATFLAARMKAENRVVAILGFTENMPSGTALQPGNIIKARSGKTVEIINTDAEGRLILADLLDFSSEFDPSLVVDIATLTGAVSTALGKQCAALFGNDLGVVSLLKRIGDSAGERLWELPLWDEYLHDMRSDVADLKNTCNDSLGGTIRAAVFLKQFVKKGTPWAHIDIAAMGFHVSHLNYIPKRGASGLYVRTLARLILDYGKSNAT